MIQPSLPFSPQVSRRSDPETSHQAEQFINRTGARARMIAIAYDAVKKNPGWTSAELERDAGEIDGAIRKRLNDLWKSGMIRKGEPRKCRISGRSAQTWWVMQ